VQDERLYTDPNKANQTDMKRSQLKPQIVDSKREKDVNSPYEEEHGPARLKKKWEFDQPECLYRLGTTIQGRHI